MTFNLFQGEKISSGRWRRGVGVEERVEKGWRERRNVLHVLREKEMSWKRGGGRISCSERERGLRERKREREREREREADTERDRERQTDTEGQ